MEVFSIIAGWFEAGWDIIKIGVVVNEYDGVIIMRNGRYKRTCKPGWAWKLPFIEEANSCFISMETFSTRAQSVLTKDRQSVMIEGAVKGRVISPRDFLIKVRDFENSLSDIVQGIIKSQVCIRTLDQCMDPEVDLDNEITKKARVEGKKFGLEIESVILTTFDKVRSLRMINQ